MCGGGVVPCFGDFGDMWVCVCVCVRERESCL